MVAVVKVAEVMVIGKAPDLKRRRIKRAKRRVLPKRRMRKKVAGYVVNQTISSQTVLKTRTQRKVRIFTFNPSV